MENVKELVEKTVNTTVSELKKQHLLKGSTLTSFQKTEKALYYYGLIKVQNTGGRSTDQFIRIMESALKQLRHDPYYDVIVYKYFERKTNEEIAELLYCDVSTVSRNKRRLVRKLSFMIFSDQVITENFFN